MISLNYKALEFRFNSNLFFKEIKCLLFIRILSLDKKYVVNVLVINKLLLK